MQNVIRPERGRSMSMQEYDIPLRQRLFSAQLTTKPLLSLAANNGPPGYDVKRVSADGGVPSTRESSSPGSSPPASPPDGGSKEYAQLLSNWSERRCRRRQRDGVDRNDVRLEDVVNQFDVKYDVDQTLTSIDNRKKNRIKQCFRARLVCDNACESI